MSDWTYPPSDDEDVQASRDATGQMYMTFKAGFYTGWWTSMNAKHGYPKTRTRQFSPEPDSATVSADGKFKLVAFRIATLLEGDEDIINEDHPNVTELTRDAWVALLPTEEP